MGLGNSRARLGIRILTIALGATAPAVSAISAHAAVTPGGLWHLDETSGQVATDASGAHNDGTLHGGVVIGVAGVSGTAYDFSKDGSWVEVPSSSSLNPGGDDFSVSAWVNLEVAPVKGTTYDIVRKGTVKSAGGEFKLEIIKNGYARCTARDADRNTVRVNSPRINLANGQWHQVTCVRSGSSWKIVTDGRTRSKTVSLGSVSNVVSLSIGSKYGNEDGTPGRVDEVQVTTG
jgi:hypothetical protein